MKNLLLLFAGVSFLFISACEKKVDITAKNKTILLRAEELWNTGNMDISDEIFATDFVNHDPNTPEVIDLEGFKRFIVTVRTSLPDFHVTHEDMIAAGDRVAIRWAVGGTHQGELLGIQPTGKQAEWTGITIYRFADGKIAEAWWNKDVLGLLQQLGVIPPMGREDFSWGEPSKLTGDPGDPEANKAMVRRELEEVWHQGNLAALNEIYSTDFVNHDPSRPQVTDLESYKGWASACLTDYPDLHMSIEDMIAEGNKVVYRWTFIGTHKDLGKQVSDPGITICRFADGKIVEAWLADDLLGAQMQLGIIPLPERGGE
jgi:steroid delta-isomerase-like uncharacterized protein